MTRTLVITNDFPPRRGGIESFVVSLCDRLPDDQVVVYTSSTQGGEESDRSKSYPVVRHPSPALLPTRSTARRAADLLRSTSCDSVLFGAAAPLGLMAPALRSAGARRIVALTHGHEAAWARTPMSRWALRRIGEHCDVLTYVSDYCRAGIAEGLSAEAAQRMVRLAPGVDTEQFHHGTGGDELRQRCGIGPRQPVVLSASRLVARKGQDVLIEAMPEIVAAVPDLVLVVVGDGPARSHLERLASRRGVQSHVVFAGSVPWAEMPAWFDTADLFVGASRSRWGGLEPEALGIVFLEAQATGCPVLVGRSGGAPETVRDGVTGYVVDPRSTADIAARVIGLLGNEERRQRFGESARRWVDDSWGWQRSVQTLRALLEY